MSEEISEDYSPKYTYEEFMTIYDNCENNNITSNNPILEKIVHELDTKNNQILKKRKKRRSNNSRYGVEYNSSAKQNSSLLNRKSNGWSRRQESTDEISTKQQVEKRINLILNSVIDTNTEAISNKIQKIFSSIEDNDKEASTLYLTQQIVKNAIMQSLYSNSYVKIIKMLSEIISKDMVKMILDKCNNSLSELESNNLSKQGCKGYGCLYTYLYIEKLTSFTQIKKYFIEVIKLLNKTVLNTVQDGCCEIIVNSFAIILKLNLNYSSWQIFLKKNILPLLDDDSLSLRVKMRLMDIKDRLK